MYIYVCVGVLIDVSIIFFAMSFFALVCYFLELLRLFRCFTCTYLDMCFYLIYSFALSNRVCVFASSLLFPFSPTA